jgi:NAD(P)-dependent dehydrogenase (short-subunit alcohol dehydrogenase family)
VALITGASQGVGRAIALAYAAQGAELLLAARGVAALEQVAAEVAARGARAHVIPCDVSDPAQVEAMAATAHTRAGGVDILVNNAGIAGSHKLIGHPDELWQRIIDVNLTAVFRVTRAIVPQMVLRRWGRVITIASIASRVGNRYMAAYTASKHGVLGLTRALAVELNPDHITVNAICPGYVNTPMTDGTIANIVMRTGRSPEAARDTLAATSPQNRLIETDEIAAVAVMLAGEAARGITGQAINIDGGAIMS